MNTLSGLGYPTHPSQNSEEEKCKSRRVGSRKNRRKINSTFAEHSLVKQWQKEESFIEDGLSFGFENRKINNPFQTSIFNVHDTYAVSSLSANSNLPLNKTILGEHRLTRKDRLLLKRYKFDAEIIDSYEKRIVALLHETITLNDYETISFDDTYSESESLEDWVTLINHENELSHGNAVLETSNSIIRFILHSLCRFYGLNSVSIGREPFIQTLIIVPNHYNSREISLPQKSFCEFLRNYYVVTSRR